MYTPTFGLTDFASPAAANQVVTCACGNPMVTASCFVSWVDGFGLLAYTLFSESVWLAVSIYTDKDGTDESVSIGRVVRVCGKESGLVIIAVGVECADSSDRGRRKAGYYYRFGRRRHGCVGLGGGGGGGYEFGLSRGVFCQTDTLLNGLGVGGGFCVAFGGTGTRRHE